MKRILFFLALVCLGEALHAQKPYTYTIKADSVKITNTCDTAELIIENHTQNVPGFLFNKGRGRTEFRRGLTDLTNNVYLIGADTLDFNKMLGGIFYKQGGNNFGTTALLGTKDNHPLTFIQNGAEKGRIETTGNWLFNTTEDKGYPVQFNGNIWQSGILYQDKNVNIVPVGGVYGDARINIGSGNSVVGHGAMALGQGMQVNSTGEFAFGVGYYNIVNKGIGIFGSTDKGVAIGVGSYAHLSSVALGIEAQTTNPYQFVCGGPDHHLPNANWSNQVTDIYFGSGVQRAGVDGFGLAYTINGSGAYGTNYAGGDITIAGGKGTGSANPGNIIFSTATGLPSGNTLQPLSEKARIVGGSGNLLINTNTDNGSKLQVNGSSYFNGTQDITGGWSNSNGASHTRYYPTITNSGSDWSEISGMRIAPTINFSANNQLGYGLYIEPDYRLNGTSQYPDAISSALHVRSTLGGIKVTQTASVPGNTGQPIFIEQSGLSNKELIYNFRNHNLTTKPFIWNNDTRPEGNRDAVVSALRSTIGNVEAGGGIAYTLDRYYYGTEASIVMKYETTPKEDTGVYRNTSIAFNTMSLGTGYTSLFLYGNKAGLGTTTPSAQLHTTGSVRFAGLANNNSLTRILVSDANGNLYYKEDSSYGTFNGYLNSDLAVNGRVSAQKMLITQTGRWPDYVFSKQYQLPSLTEVENFIKQNNHLPGIPSAAEVEKKGIDVGGNQAALLQKIEELTLYIIEQEKTIEKQSGQIKELLSLKQEMAELKALIKKQ